jgi:dienelactone hydrolase
MRYFIYVLLLLSVSTLSFGATDAIVTYAVNGQSCEGHYTNPFDQAPFVLLIHNWDGLTDYEIKRAHMIADAGLAVFAVALQE